MTSRERNLAIGVAALLAAWGLWNAFGWYQGAVETGRQAVTDAQDRLDTARKKQREVLAAVERLEAYQQQSLPADPQVAQQEYTAWLIDQLEAAELDFQDVALTDKRPQGEAFTSLGYTATATGTLEQVTRLLHAFYDSPLLHKMTRLQLVPIGNNRLRATLGVQALVVAGADRKEGVPEGGSGRPRLGGAEAYLASLGDRNLFKPYVPPPPPRPPTPPRPVVKRSPPPPPPKFDDAAHAYVTGIVGAGDRLKAWITVRTTGEVLRLGAGDELKVGLIDGRVESVAGKRMIYSADGARYATPLGSHLREAKKLGDAEPAS
ncbi:MAG: hypothetical protein AAGJ46_06405 [Planctomycetota bacterium]